MTIGIHHLTVEELHHHLRGALRHGARASRLLRHTPQVVELLYPTQEHSGLNASDRAIKTEALIRRAVDAVGGQSGHAIAIILCLAVGTLDHKLAHRRSLAAQHLGIQAETFRCPWREGALLHDLAVEIYRLHTTNQAKDAATDC